MCSKGIHIYDASKENIYSTFVFTVELFWTVYLDYSPSGNDTTHESLLLHIYIGGFGDMKDACEYAVC